FQNIFWPIMMASALQKEYDKLLTKYKEMIVLRTAGDIVYWDMETKMPPLGLELRSEQLSLLGLMGHKMLVDPKIGRSLAALEKERGLADMTEEQRRNVHLMRKHHDEESKLPDKLVAEMPQQQILSVGAWKRAKAAKDFSQFRDHLL